MATKTRLPIITTPPGVAVWPHLNKPDQYENNVPEYSVKLRFDPSDERYQKFRARMNDLHAEAVQKGLDENGAKAKRWTIKDWEKPEYDEDDNETGMVLVRFALKSQGENRKTGETWENRVGLFDAQNQPITSEIGGGSVLRCAFQAIPYATSGVGIGIGMRLKAVRVIELVEYTGGASASEMFGDVEDGYDAGGSNEGEDY